MTDIEKERELSEEGMEMNEKNEVELKEAEESSLAADQESVTKKEDISKKKNDSVKIPDDSSKETIPQKNTIDGTSQDKTVTEANEKEKPESDNTSLTPQKAGHKNEESAAPQDSQATAISADIKQEPDNKKSENTQVTISDSVNENPPESQDVDPVEKSPDDKSEKKINAAGNNDIDNSDAKDSSDGSDDKKENADKDKQKDASIDEPPSKQEDSGKPEVKEKKSDEEVSGSIKKDDDKEEHSEDEDLEDEEIDYSQLAKDELINAFEKIFAIEDIKTIEKKIKELRPFYDDIVEEEKSSALKKFIDEGGAEIDFQYVGDALDARFHNLYEKYKAKRNAYYSELEKSKEDNLLKKQEVLEKLRDIVDGEETNASISALKNIQKEWRSIGPVPSSNAKSLWATFNILIDRFYDNRSIYFELKELDRKKNLEAKLELCEKAEQLLDYEVIRDAVKELNELHEEFKHVGPVPVEMQEVVWQRFKSASDAIYERRKDYVSSLKKELHDNFELKKQLVNEVAIFDEFDSDKISEWNEKTKQILEIQKKWESIGGLPREHAKEINRNFWSSFKTFFNNKNKFFKKLESQRDDNLVKKEALVKRAEELKNSDEWEKTADILKELQKEWKDIGPIPEKNRNEVYRKFKNACDTFFNRRREHSKEVESEYKVNLRKKEEICAEIEKMVRDNEKNIDRFKEIQVQFNSIGFVPRNTIKRIQKKYGRATELFLNSFDLSDAEKSELKFAAEVDKLKSGPNSDRRIQRKEVEVRRHIGKIENDIALWKNNIEFFAQSKTADKVKEEFNNKIEKATEQLKELREELKMLNKI
jgi:ribosomal protein L17